MDKIEKYIISFFKRVKMKDKYDLSLQIWRILSERARENPSDATGTSFLYGYAKGYRAAMDEMKKGGAAAVINRA